MIKSLLGDEDGPGPVAEDYMVSAASESDLFGGDPANLSKSRVERPFAISAAEPLSPDETARRNGLAFSAGIAFFASVVFMLILGWGADLLLGSSPWGIVGGIIIGSLIGFVQLFRLSSQIFKK